MPRNELLRKLKRWCAAGDDGREKHWKPWPGNPAHAAHIAIKLTNEAGEWIFCMYAPPWQAGESMKFLQDTVPADSNTGQMRYQSLLSLHVACAVCRMSAFYQAEEAAGSAMTVALEAVFTLPSLERKMSRTAS